MKWIDLPVEEVAARYRAGENTGELGYAYGVSHETIWRRLRAAGVELRGRGRRRGYCKRGGSLYLITGGYLTTRDRHGKQSLIHRGCWEAHHGPIPDGCVIHHINGDTLDNEVENLCCMVDSEHRRMHATKESGMRTIVAVLLMTLLACAGASAEEQEDGWEDWYGMLEVQAGTTYEFALNTPRTYVAGKLGGWKELTGIIGTEFDVDENTEAKGPVAGLAGVTYNLGSLADHGVKVSWAKHVGFNVGLGVTYDWDESEWGWRGLLSIVDLSFSGGGAERQKNR